MGYNRLNDQVSLFLACEDNRSSEKISQIVLEEILYLHGVPISIV